MPLGFFRVAMSILYIQSSAVEPMSVAEARKHLRLDTSAQDDLVSAALTAARASAEHITRRRFVAARMRLHLDSFPLGGAEIVIPCTPVRRVLAIRYTPPSGLSQVAMPPEHYALVPGSQPGRVALTPAAWCWPQADAARLMPVEVDFVAGHAAPAAVDLEADTVSVDLLPLAVGDEVSFSVSGDSPAMPAPLRPGIVYFVVEVVDAGVYRVSTSQGGTPLDFTSSGSGQLYVGEIPPEAKAWMKLRLAALDVNREEVAAPLAPLPFADRLLDSLRVYA